MKKENFVKKYWLVLLTGFIIGVAALVLQKLGNPGNMGFCIACFERDIAGALGLHTAGAAVTEEGTIGVGNLAYFRPEIIGILLGSMIMAICTKEFKGRGGSSPVLRFLLGGKQNLTIIVPGDTVRELSICEVKEGKEGGTA